MLSDIATYEGIELTFNSAIISIEGKQSAENTKNNGAPPVERADQ